MKNKLRIIFIGVGVSSFGLLSGMEVGKLRQRQPEVVQTLALASVANAQQDPTRSLDKRDNYQFSTHKEEDCFSACCSAVAIGVTMAASVVITYMLTVAFK